MSTDEMLWLYRFVQQITNESSEGLVRGTDGLSIGCSNDGAYPGLLFGRQLLTQFLFDFFGQARCVKGIAQ